MWIDKRNVKNFKEAVFGFISGFPKSLKKLPRNSVEFSTNLSKSNRVFFIIFKKKKFQKSLNLIGCRQITASVMSTMNQSDTFVYYR